jgi:small subunit ribosomal protein S8e
MVISQKETHGRTITGGRVYLPRRKRLYEAGRQATATRVGNRKTLLHRQKGGSYKLRLSQADTANVFDPKSKKYIKATITIVSGNAANRNFVRRNIMTKGAIIETSAGKARVTNRPGQEGQINAILV